MARNLYGGLDPVGQELRVRNVPFTIIGVMSRKRPDRPAGRIRTTSCSCRSAPARQRVLGRNQANAPRGRLDLLVKVRER